jgi:hypothetical protein
MSTKFKSIILKNAAAVRDNILNQNILRTITRTIALCVPLVCASQANAQTTYSIPAVIQAEALSSGGGVKNVEASTAGGGVYTASIDAGDWINYQNHKVVLPYTGEYVISYRVASQYDNSAFTFNNINPGGSLSKINKIVVPKTGGTQEWTIIQRTVTLKAGPHYFGVRALERSFSLDWIRITSVSQASSSSKVSSSSSSKSSVVSSRAVSSAVKSSVPSSSKAASSLPSSSKAASVVSSKAASSSSVPAKSSASSAVASGYTRIDGPVGLTWIAPQLRADKSSLDITELGGYRLRYKSVSDSKFTYITINDPWTTTYNFSWLEGDYLFEIAAFDKAGLLSEFSNFTD